MTDPHCDQTDDHQAPQAVSGYDILDSEYQQYHVKVLPQKAPFYSSPSSCFRQSTLFRWRVGKGLVWLVLQTPSV